MSREEEKNFNGKNKKFTRLIFYDWSGLIPGGTEGIKKIIF